MKTYIRFIMPPNETLFRKPGGFETFFMAFLTALLTRIIPKANPDFDDKIENVKEWLVEIEDQYPSREVGMDEHGQAIVKMPWNKNYGYWCDNNLNLEDFKTRFNAKEIEKSIFEQYWQTIK